MDNQRAQSLSNMLSAERKFVEDAQSYCRFSVITGVCVLDCGETIQSIQVKSVIFTSVYKVNQFLQHVGTAESTCVASLTTNLVI